jgi:hypothetical protein
MYTLFPRPVSGLRLFGGLVYVFRKDLLQVPLDSFQLLRVNNEMSAVEVFNNKV